VASARVYPPGVRTLISNSLWSSMGRNVFPTTPKSGTVEATIATDAATTRHRCRSDHASTRPYHASIDR